MKLSIGRALIAMLGCALLMLLLAACSGGSNDSQGEGTSSVQIVSFATGLIATLAGVAVALVAARRVPRNNTNFQVSIRDPQSGVRVEVNLHGDPRSIEHTVESMLALVNSQRLANADIVQLSSQIERTGNELLEKSVLRSQQGSKRGLFQLRDDLLAAGIWSIGDVAKFDRVVRQRNAVVHGDRQDPEALKAALLEAQELLTAMKDRPGGE